MNRTSVAGSVPAELTRLRCAALRTVWKPAAEMTMGIHSQLVIEYFMRYANSLLASGYGNASLWKRV